MTAAEGIQRIPASKIAHALANDMLCNGSPVSVTGTCDNVVKIRPPLVFSHDNAEQLLETMSTCRDYLGSSGA